MGGYNPAFWGREKLTWALGKGPQWLKLEGAALVGRPGEADAGQQEVVLKVANSKGDQAVQKFTITVTK